MRSRTFLFVACFSLLVSSINGQDSLKTNAHKRSTELNFNPFDGSLTLNNTNTQIKVRKFITNSKALRIAFTTSYKQDNSNAKSVYGPFPINTSTYKKSFLALVNVGIEHHLTGSKRISPYWGWEVGLGFKTSKQNSKDGTESRIIKGAWETTQTVYNGSYYYYLTVFDERGFWNLGGNLILGFDFFMSNDFYFGYEILFGFDYYKYSNIDVKLNYSDGHTYPKLSDESWKLGPKLVNGIRIGFMF
jgi:hypothetical protein